MTIQPEITYRENFHMLRPTDALREMHTTAAGIVNPSAFNYLSKVLPSAPDDLRLVVQARMNENWRLRQKVSRICAAATPFLWSNEMYDAMYVAAAEYPYQGQRWTLDLIGELPAYHALEQDRASDHMLANMREYPELADISHLDPKDTTIFSFLYYRENDIIRFVVFIAASGFLIPLDLPLGRLGDEIDANARAQAGMFEFLRSPYVTAMAIRADRAERRRLTRRGIEHQPAVRVVLLRRQSQQHESGESETVEWSYRWFVRGHWHSYWVGVGDKRRLEPRWLAPYIKGPDDKPLKPPRATVFAVVR